LATVRNFEVISDKFIAVRIYTNGNNLQKWVPKWYNYSSTALLSLTKYNEAFQRAMVSFF